MPSEKQYKLLLESLPISVICCFFFLFIIIFAFLGLLVGAFAPTTYDTRTEPVPFQQGKEMEDFINTVSGRDPIEVRLNGVDRFNGEIRFLLTLFSNETMNQITGFSQEVKYELKLYGSRDLDADIGDVEIESIFERLTWKNNTRIITCPQGRQACTPLMVFHEPSVRYRTYLLIINIWNQEEQASKFFYAPKATVTFNYVNSRFSVFEVVYRYVFLAVTFAFLIVFLFLTRLRQPFSHWHTEQRWMVLLLFLLFLFNNPLYIFQFFTSNWLFVFLNIIFRISFVAMFLFSLLVFTHAMITKPSERGMSFYTPKIFLVATMWGVFLVTFIYARLTSLSDPSYSIVNDFPYYKFVLSFLMTLVCIYVLWLLYFIIRGLSLMQERTQYSMKFRVVWGMTLLIIVAAALVYVSLNAFGKATTALSFVAFQVLFNFYTYLLAFLFLPSNVPQTMQNV
jgi:MFS family permease